MGASTANRNVVFNNVVVSFQASEHGDAAVLHGASDDPALSGSPAGGADGDRLHDQQWRRQLRRLRGGRHADDQQQHDHGALRDLRAGRDADDQRQHDHGELRGDLLRGGGGTASGNTIGFSGSGTGRFGIYVAGSATPTLSGNTILDDPQASDTGISVLQGAGNAMTQILNNIICATGGDMFIVVPNGFAGTVSGNLNQCGAPTSTPTVAPIATATRTATMTPTNASTMTPTGTASSMPTQTPTVTVAQTTTATFGATQTSTPTVTTTPTTVLTGTPTHTATNSPTNTPTGTASAVQTGTATPSATATTTPSATASATGTPASVVLAGRVLVPGRGGLPSDHGQVPIGGVQVDLFLCEVRTPCLGMGDPVASVFTAPDGRFFIRVSAALVQGTLPVVAARVSPTVVLRTPVLTLPALTASTHAVARQVSDMTEIVVDAISEAAVRLLAQLGFENFNEQGLGAVVQAVKSANAESTFEDLTPETAVTLAQTTAAADPMVQKALQDNLLPTPTPTQTPGGCVGDCDSSGEVTIDEVIKGVNIALGNATVDTCRQFDVDGSGTVTINELIVAVNNVLSGCH